MSKEYYCRQKFLFDSTISVMDLEKYYTCKPTFLQDYKEQINLFDDDNVSRSIDISELDCNIDNLSDFESLIKQTAHVNTIYILDSRTKTDNSIISNFQQKSLKAYINFFEKYGKNCKVICN